MTEELIRKGREAGSVEELIKLAEENGVELSEKEGEAYFSALHRTGEISDDELDSVAGGACHITTSTYDRTTYTVVTSGCKCFTGLYERDESRTGHDDWYGPWFRFSKEGCCGYCRHLWIIDGIGFCSKTARQLSES